MTMRQKAVLVSMATVCAVFMAVSKEYVKSGRWDEDDKIKVSVRFAVKEQSYPAKTPDYVVLTVALQPPLQRQWYIRTINLIEDGDTIKAQHPAYLDKNNPIQEVFFSGVKKDHSIEVNLCPTKPFSEGTKEREIELAKRIITEGKGILITNDRESD